MPVSNDIVVRKTRNTMRKELLTMGCIIETKDGWEIIKTPKGKQLFASKFAREGLFQVKWIEGLFDKVS